MSAISDDGSTVNKKLRIVFDDLHRITYKNCFTRFRLAQMEQTADKNRKSTRSNLELKFKPLVTHNGFVHGSCDSLVDDQLDRAGLCVSHC